MFGSRNFLFARSAAVGGKLYSWGENANKQLGLGLNTTNYSSPKQVGSTTTWTQISGGGLFAAGLVTSSTRVWGNNDNGQMGNSGGSGPPVGYSPPASQGVVIPDVSFLNTARFGVRIVKTNGTLFGWGNNTYGGLGLGDTVNKYSPTQVGALTNWSRAGGLASFSCVAIKTDGTLWTWGDNRDGRLGIGNTTNYSSPKQVGSDTNWASFANYGRGRYGTAAIKTNGTLFTWSRNNHGQLGLGNTTDYSSPKQVAGTTWSKVACHYQGFAAVKTDGTLFTWGRNNNGQLGLGDTTNRSSPSQVGALTNWALPIGGYYFNACVKTDGTLWSWGRNNVGQLGLGNTTDYSSPKQVGSLTTWISGATANNSMFGIAS